jgi:hypothetical protein
MKVSAYQKEREMGIRKNILIVLAFCILVLSPCPAALSKSEPGAGRGDSKSHEKKEKNSPRVTVDVFVGHDRDVIREYFHRHEGNLPPGLAKRNGNLPPGLKKQLQRKGHLPPGLEKTVTPLPVELENRLYPLKPGLVRGVIEGRAVIFNGKTSVILDILSIF